MYKKAAVNVYQNGSQNPKMYIKTAVNVYQNGSFLGNL